MGRVCLLLAPLTVKQVRFGNQTSFWASKTGFITELDLHAGFSHAPRHENDVSGRSQRACASTVRKAISYPLILRVLTIGLLVLIVSTFIIGLGGLF